MENPNETPAIGAEEIKSTFVGVLSDLLEKVGRIGEDSANSKISMIGRNCRIEPDPIMAIEIVATQISLADEGIKEEIKEETILAGRIRRDPFIQPVKIKSLSEKLFDVFFDWILDNLLKPGRDIIPLAQISVDVIKNLDGKNHIYFLMRLFDGAAGSINFPIPSKEKLESGTLDMSTTHYGTIFYDDAGQARPVYGKMSFDDIIMRFLDDYKDYKDSQNLLDQ